MADLHNSRWAPSSSRSRDRSPPRPGQVRTTTTQSQVPPPTTTSTPQQRRAKTRLEEFHRFIRLLRRLHWKSRLLVISQSLVQEFHANNTHGDPQRLLKELREAETMFKIDFFEWYVLLERAVVHLLAVFGIAVPASALRGSGDDTINTIGTTNNSASSSAHRSTTNGTGTGIRPFLGDAQVFNHRFHANVLSALDQDTNPLHTVLGTGDVRNYIGIAKEFRNRWKDVDDDQRANRNGLGDVGANGTGTGTAAEREGQHDLPRRYQKMLQDLKLEEMLDCILTNLEEAKRLATEECERVRRESGVGIHAGWAMEDMDVLMELDNSFEPWEAMPDAMDWD